MIQRSSKKRKILKKLKKGFSLNFLQTITTTTKTTTKNNNNNNIKEKTYIIPTNIGLTKGINIKTLKTLKKKIKV